MKQGIYSSGMAGARKANQTLRKKKNFRRKKHRGKGDKVCGDDYTEQSNS